MTGTRIAAIAVAVVASWHCARLAWADSRFRLLTPGGLRDAVRWCPDNTRYLATLAQVSDAAPLLERIVQLSPYDAGARIRLGLIAESAGRLDEAERRLLDAASISRRYEPRWTLANFYFRRDDRDRFLHWSREALAVSYGDRAPLFDLCTARNACREALPARREVRLAFAQYAAERGRFADAAPLVAELAAEASEPERRALLPLCDRMAENRRIPEARAAWLQLAPGEPPFSWHAVQPHGIGVYPRSSGGWSLSFDGSQPEEAELLWKIAPGGNCRLDVRDPGDDLRWSVESFGPDAVRVALRYQRLAGAMRREGTVEIERVHLSCAP